MSAIYKKITKILLCWVSVSILASCAYLKNRLDSETVTQVKVPASHEQLFEKAEQAAKAGDNETAQALYFKISREPSGPLDPAYDKSLWNLAMFYESTDQSERALLALNELESRPTNTISKARILFSEFKNHFRVTNYYQAKKVRGDIDTAYKSQLITQEDLFDALYYTSTLYYDRHILDELSYLGDVQKYFIFVMESDASPQNEKLTDLLIFYYDGFFHALNKNVVPAELKRQLIVSLIDQLRKFDKFEIAKSERNPLTIDRFTQYAEAQQKKLTERLTDEHN